MQYVRLDAVLEILDKKVHEWRIRAQAVQGTCCAEDARPYNYMADETVHLSEYIKFKAYGPGKTLDDKYLPYWIEGPEWEAIDLDMREID